MLQRHSETERSFVVRCSWLLNDVILTNFQTYLIILEPQLLMCPLPKLDSDRGIC